MQIAYGDHQVSMYAAAVEARTIGARVHTPALDAGPLPRPQPVLRHPDRAPAQRLPRLGDHDLGQRTGRRRSRRRWPTSRRSTARPTRTPTSIRAAPRPRARRRTHSSPRRASCSTRAAGGPATPPPTCPERAPGGCRRSRGRRAANPQSVIPRSAATAIASVLGAPTPTSTGAPATAAFCTSSNDSRPLTHSSRSVQRHQAVEQRPPDDLVHRVVAPDVLARQRRARRRRRTARWRAAPRSARTRAARAGRAARLSSSRATTGPGRQRLADHRHLLDRPLAAHPARGRGVEAPEARDRAAAGPATSTVLAAKSAVGPAARDLVDQALGVQEAERQLLVLARGAHRHRQRPAVDPDLQRLLDRDQVVAAVVADGGERARHAAQPALIARVHRGRPDRAAAPPWPTTSTLGESARSARADSSTWALSQVAG